MYFVPEGTKICGYYECEDCGMRFLSVVVMPYIVCPYCGEEVDMEIGPDEEMPQAPEKSKLIKVVENEEVEMMATQPGDYRRRLCVDIRGGKFMLVLVYRKCSTCIKALNWLAEKQVNFEERPIVEKNPTYEELKEWHEKSGLPLKKFFNTSGLLYKELGLKDKLGEMTEEEQLRLLATNGMLVKRPLVVGENFVLTGFREKEWEEKLL